MKTLLLNTFENYGGAAIATNRLHQGLLDLGVDSRMLVQRKFTGDDTVICPSGFFSTAISKLRPSLDSLPLRAYPEKNGQLFSPAVLPESISSKVRLLNPDVVHLFWVTSGFLRVESLANFRKPIIWTLHDMWPFTGGCHYDNACGRYTNSCGNCPVLGSKRLNDLSHSVIMRKRNAWERADITVVATSEWLARCARASDLFKSRRIEIIPNAFNTSRFKPIDKAAARNAFDLPQDKKLVLFSSFSATTDKRKGFQHLVPALQNLTDAEKSMIELIVLGGEKPKDPINFGMPVHYISHLHDEISQVLLYSAADVLVLPSEQENLSNTVIEAMLCGTPVVAFNVGGMPDIISHKISGYLAEPFDSGDLARGILSTVEYELTRERLSAAARESATIRYDAISIATRYRDLYEDVTQ